MAKPKFGKKCYQCDNRFLCWTEKEPTPTPDAEEFPRCEKCGCRLEATSEWEKNHFKVDKEVWTIKLRCPEKRLWNWHDFGRYARIVKDKWIWFSFF